MHLNYDMRRRLATPPDLRQLEDGTWLAQRLGLGATGTTTTGALAALVARESLHCNRLSLMGAPEEASTEAGTMQEGLGELMDWVEG